MSSTSGSRRRKIRPLHGSQLQHYVGNRTSSPLRRRSSAAAADVEYGVEATTDSPATTKRAASTAGLYAAYRKRRSADALAEKERRGSTSLVVSAAIKVYANVLHPDVLYKTAHVHYGTTATDVVAELIERYAVNDDDKDPGMFCLVETDGQRILRVLDDRERPLVVQTDWPKDSYRFRLCRRPDYPATTTRKETSPEQKQLPSGGSSTKAGSPTLSAARELTAKDMYVSVATPFGGKFQSVKTEIDEDTTARQVLEQTLFEYDVSLDPDDFNLYEVWIEEPSRRKKGRQVHPAELGVALVRRLKAGKITLLQLRKKLSEEEKRKKKEGQSLRVSRELSISSSSLSSLVSVEGGAPTSRRDLSADYQAVIAKDWEQRWDEKSQKNYYVNKVTRESSWLNPASFLQPNANSDLPFGWERSYDRKTKRIYYVNHLTKETTWKNPAKHRPDSKKDQDAKRSSLASPDSGAFFQSPSPDEENEPKTPSTRKNQTGRRAGEPVILPSTPPPPPSPSMYETWTPQPERQSHSRSSSSSSQSVILSRSERTRRSARLRGMMLQSLHQGMSGMMENIAREGRGGLWTPRETRKVGATPNETTGAKADFSPVAADNDDLESCAGDMILDESERRRNADTRRMPGGRDAEAARAREELRRITRRTAKVSPPPPPPPTSSSSSRLSDEIGGGKETPPTARVFPYKKQTEEDRKRTSEEEMVVEEKKSASPLFAVKGVHLVGEFVSVQRPEVSVVGHVAAEISPAALSTENDDNDEAPSLKKWSPGTARREADDRKEAAAAEAAETNPDYLSESVLDLSCSLSTAISATAETTIEVVNFTTVSSGETIMRTTTPPPTTTTAIARVGSDDGENATATPQDEKEAAAKEASRSPASLEFFAETEGVKVAETEAKSSLEKDEDVKEVEKVTVVKDDADNDFLLSSKADPKKESETNEMENKTVPAESTTSATSSTTEETSSSEKNVTAAELLSEPVFVSHALKQSLDSSEDAKETTVGEYAIGRRRKSLTGWRAKLGALYSMANDDESLGMRRRSNTVASGLSVSREMRFQTNPPPKPAEYESKATVDNGAKEETRSGAREQKRDEAVPNTDTATDKRSSLQPEPVVPDTVTDEKKERIRPQSEEVVHGTDTVIDGKNEKASPQPEKKTPTEANATEEKKSEKQKTQTLPPDEVKAKKVPPPTAPRRRPSSEVLERLAAHRRSLQLGEEKSSKAPAPSHEEKTNAETSPSQRHRPVLVSATSINPSSPRLKVKAQLTNVLPTRKPISVNVNESSRKGETGSPTTTKGPVKSLLDRRRFFEQEIEKSAGDLASADVSKRPPPPVPKKRFSASFIEASVSNSGKESPSRSSSRIEVKTSRVDREEPPSSPTTADSPPRQTYSAKMRFFEEKIRLVERDQVSRQTSRAARSKSFAFPTRQQSAVPLAEEKRSTMNTSQSPVVEQDGGNGGSALAKSPKGSPTSSRFRLPARSSPILDSSRFTKDRFEKLEAELEKIESDVYKLVPESSMSASQKDSDDK